MTVRLTAATLGKYRTWPVFPDADCTYLRSVSAVLPAVLRPNARGGHPIIAFIKDGTAIRKILEHIGVDPTPPKIAPARGPPLWDGCDVDVEEYVADPDAWNYVAQRTPDSDPQIDQSIGW